MNGTKWLISLEAGAGAPEPPVPNDIVLRFFARHGLYIRLLNAFQAWKVLLKEKPSDAERYAALVSFWEQAGMIYESAMSLVVALASMADDPTVSLATAQRSIFVRKDKKQPPAGVNYSDWICTRVSAECAKPLGARVKTVPVNAKAFLADLEPLSGEEIAKRLGIPWKLRASIRLVPQSEKKNWRNVPILARGVVDALATPKKELLEVAYNKLKHGPQFVVMDPFDSATSMGVHDQVPWLRGCGPTIRVLFDGARTAASGPDERVAPFIIPDPYVLGRVCKETLFPLVAGISLMAEWAHRVHLGRPPAGPKLQDDDALFAMFKELERSKFIGP